MLKIQACTDASLLAEMNKEVQQMHHVMYPDIFKPYNADDIIAALVDILRQPAVAAFVAYIDNIPSGYIITIEKEYMATAFRYGSKALYIDQIGVLPTYRKNGIASELIKYSIAIARDKGIQRLESDHWADNEAARSFFKKQGFAYYREMIWLDLK